MNELKIIGEQEINGVKITHIEGGFGENQKCILAKDVAIKHNQELKEINRLIVRNYDKFNANDVIDFLGGSEPLRDFAKENGLIGSNRTQNVFMFSERGYIKLVSMMDNSNETKWEVMNEIIDNYFSMREQIQTTTKEKLLLQLFSNDPSIVANAHKQLVELETKPLVEKIENDKPLVSFADRVLKDGDNILVRELAKIITDEGYKIGQNRLYDTLREWGYICKNSTEPTQRAMEQGYFIVETRVINTPYGTKQTFTSYVTPKGQIKIVEKIIKIMKEKEKQND